MGVEVLISFITRQEAGRYVAQQAHKLGLQTTERKPITAKTVLAWRDEIGTAKSEIGAEVFRRLKKRRASAGPLPDQKQAKALAKQYLVEARIGGFWGVMPGSSAGASSGNRKGETDG